MKSPNPKTRFCLVAFILFLCLPSTSIGHDVAEHLDPVLVGMVLMTVWTVRYWSRSRGQNGTVELALRSLTGVTLCIGPVIGYIMMITLLLHEGVDHAL